MKIKYLTIIIGVILIFSCNFENKKTQRNLISDTSTTIIQIDSTAVVTKDTLKTRIKSLNLCLDYFNFGFLELPINSSFFFNTSSTEGKLDLETLNLICNARYIHIKNLDNVNCDVDIDSSEFNDFTLFKKDFCELNAEKYRITKLVSSDRKEKQKFFTYLVFTTQSSNLYLMTAELLDKKESCIQIKDVVTLSYSCCGVYKGRRAVFVNANTIDIVEDCQCEKISKEKKCTVKVDTKNGAIHVIYKQ